MSPGMCQAPLPSRIYCSPSVVQNHPGFFAQSIHVSSLQQGQAWSLVGLELLSVLPSSLPSTPRQGGTKHPRDLTWAA